MSRRVVITGGSSGIGLASARQFAEQGDRVTICGRDPDKLEAARGQIDGLDCHRVDVTDQQAVRAFFDDVGPVDVLVANAGVCKQARLDDHNSDDVWHDTFDVNVDGVYYCLKAASPDMPDGASIVTVSSGLGKNARAGYEAYTASKHAVLGLTKCVALELAPRDIRVNAVCPGWVDTPMSRADVAESARRAGVDQDQFRQKAIDDIPLNQMVQPENVADLIAFLASDAASAITGQSYNISCGEYFN